MVGDVIVVQTQPQTVSFLIQDVVHPRPLQVLNALYRHVAIEGRVVAQTSDGTAAFLVVRIPGLNEAVIVSHWNDGPPSEAMTATIDDE